MPVDTLKFKDQKKYPERLAAALEETGETDALVVMQGSIRSVPLVLAAFEFGFMGGSMGSVVGERFVRGVRVAYENRIPFICISASGGARMQEGVNSLFQMAKTTAVLQELTKARLPFVSILSDPTMGGVSASFAFVADVVIAEPGALIGFAGPRVIEQTVREKLPEGFQRAEFLLRERRDRHDHRPARAEGRDRPAPGDAVEAAGAGKLSAAAVCSRCRRRFANPRHRDCRSRPPGHARRVAAVSRDAAPETDGARPAARPLGLRADGHRAAATRDHRRRHQRQGIGVRADGIDAARRRATAPRCTRRRTSRATTSACASAANARAMRIS